MLIDKNWKIESDNLNVTLYRLRKSRKRWEAVGFYSSIQNALRALVDLEVASTRLIDLQTISDKQDELYNQIKNLSISLQPHSKAVRKR